MSDAPNPMDELAQAWARAMTGFLAPLGQGGASSGDAAPPGDLAGRATAAHLAAADSYWRYMKNLADASGRAYPLAVRATILWNSDPGDDGGELGAALDELREALREMYELPLKESRRLQSELADIGREREEEPKDGTDTKPKRQKRRARVKE